ncbi:iron-containing alcohol dehydrogenase [uncultured Ferrimonas sp.]|uniref:iron-containing alcohol dehydrogenase n=1 Tax=uncultured Ferrimonas sp. TaxID=432640 RepID=UPI00262B9B94|nr:iron-containing alcohol dehydrogenase [uncultured Ferrimonas sp.]
MQFQFQNPTRILFGEGQISEISQQIPADAKVLVLYGGGSIKRNGIYAQVEQALQHHQWLEFDGIEPNPTVETLDNAVKLVKAEQIDFLLAVGGGSVIDGTKYVAAAAKYQGYGWDILDGKAQVTDAMPLGCILTLPATGSESNAAAVVTRVATAEKKAFFSPLVYPQFAVLDPTAMSTLPDRQLRNGIVDAFVHICEQYLTFPAGNMVQDGYAESLLRNLIVLAQQFDDRRQPQWQANLMYTANQALNGLIGAGVAHDWATHAIGHELTTLYGLDHAQTLAVVQPALLRQQYVHKHDKLVQMGKNVFGIDGKDAAQQCINAIEALYRELGVGTKLDDYGVNRLDAVEQVSAALAEHGQLPLGEHGHIELADCEQILQRA